MTTLATANGAQVWNRDWRALVHVVAGLGGCDALIVDAPYSERTHAKCNVDVLINTQDRASRRPINYGAWSPSDVAAFVSSWSPLVRGWCVSITDHVLAPAWEAAFNSAGRYTFPPLPYVAPGSRVRLAGDGPSNWTCQIVVARPKSREFARWGTLPGAYVLPAGEGGAMPVVGGKPRWLMESLVRDYTRPGDLVVDPCCGSGSTLAAAVRLGRRAIGGDINQEHAAMASRWISDPGPQCPTEEQARQRVLF